MSLNESSSIEESCCGTDLTQKPEIKMFISKHARYRYREFHPFLENVYGTTLDAHIFKHLEKCRPVDDVEMIYIIRSKGRLVSDEISGVKHIIDDNNFVFVIDDESAVVITCYAAPYLEVIRGPMSPFSDYETRDGIIQIFQEVAKRCDSPMPWAMAMLALSDNGFQVSVDNYKRRFFTVKNALGRFIVKYVSGKKAKEKFVVEGHFTKFRWVKDGRTWCFNDFGLTCADDFIERFLPSK